MSDRDLREFLNDAGRLGFSLVGIDGANHARLRHLASGREVSISKTPSDPRTRRNELARLERLAGRRLPRQQSGHYVSKPVKRAMDVRKSDHEKRAGSDVQAMIDEATQLRADVESILKGSGDAEVTYAKANEAVAKARRYTRIREGLIEFHRFIEPIESWLP